jgi:hypothetical protein
MIFVIFGVALIISVPLVLAICYIDNINPERQYKRRKVKRK